MSGGKIFATSLCALLLFVAPSAQAQRRGGRSGHGSNAPGDTETEESKEFSHAAAVQARPEQVAAFLQMTRGDEAARRSAQELLARADSADEVDLFHYTKSLTDLVDEAEFENQQFVLSFSNSQKSGLKELAKKLKKASSELAKDNNRLARELDRSTVEGARLVAAARRLNLALADFQARQAALGTEMGISGGGQTGSR